MQQFNFKLTRQRHHRASPQGGSSRQHAYVEPSVRPISHAELLELRRRRLRAA